MQVERIEPARLTAHIEWPTLWFACGVWGLLGVATLLHDLVPWWVTVPVLAVGSGAYASLQHEVAHGHPTPWKWVNLVVAGAPIGLVYSFGRFRDLHLAHHADPSQLTDPAFDNESRYCSPDEWRRAGPLGRAMFRAERTLLGFLTIGVVRGALRYIAADLRAAAKHRYIASAWARHVVGVAAVVAVVSWTGLPISQYLVGVVYGRLFFTGIRLFAEHRAVAGATRSAVTHAGPAMSLIFLNNNLHHTHHASPGTAWYRLPALHDDLGADQLAANGAGLYRGGYLEIARRYGLRPFCQPTYPLAASEQTQPN